MTIYSGFTHWKWWFSIVYVSLPEGIQYGILVRNNIHTIILYNCVHIYSFVYRYNILCEMYKMDMWWTMHTHMHIHIYLYPLVHPCTGTICLYVYMYICIYDYICIYIFIHIYKYIIIHIYINIIETYISTCKCIHAGTYPCISLYVKESRFFEER